MPHFDADPLQNLALQAGKADADLDLRGLSMTDAMARVEALLSADSASAPRSYRILFDGPRGDGTETLFQPLGRRLLAARREGVLQSCLPLPDGNAYYVLLAD